MEIETVNNMAAVAEACVCRLSLVSEVLWEAANTAKGDRLHGAHFIVERVIEELKGLAA